MTESEAKHTTRITLELTDEEEIAVGYAIGAGLLLSAERGEAAQLKDHLYSLAAKIHDANAAAARERGGRS